MSEARGGLESRAKLGGSIAQQRNEASNRVSNGHTSEYSST
jgi:hypothetical protein